MPVLWRLGLRGGSLRLAVVVAVLVALGVGAAGAGLSSSLLSALQSVNASPNEPGVFDNRQKIYNQELYNALQSLDQRVTSLEDPPQPPPAPPPSCTTTVSSASAARTAVQNAAGGNVVCLAAGTYGNVDLRRLPDHFANPVTFRGAANRASFVNSVLFGGTSGLIIEGFRLPHGVGAGNQDTTSNVTIRLNDIGGAPGSREVFDGVHGIGIWGSSQMHTFVVERNYIHDSAGYGIRVQGDGPGWTIRQNKFERIGDGDYMQSGNPSNWLVDRNWFLGPGFRQTSNPHPDLWQALQANSPGTTVIFSSNRVHETDFGPGSGLNGVTTGFMFGNGTFHDLQIVNNLLNRISDGNTCAFTSPADGFLFENNTIRTGRNGWTCLLPASAGSPYSVTHNVLTNSESTQDLDTSPPHMSDGMGQSENVSDEPITYGTGSIQNWTPNWSGDGWYRAQGLPFAAGHSLAPAEPEFQGYPFN
jgi:hypothetical protein